MALASGEERTTVGDDLVIRTDTRWAGGTLGGYLPVRVEIANQAPARAISLEVTPSDRAHGATVKRVVTVDQHATVRLTLSIPLTAFRHGLFRVYDGRGELPSHVRLIGGATLFGVETAPAMLVVSSRPVDCTNYIRAAGGARRTPFGALPATDASALAEVVPPDSLPDSWIDYSGLDFVAISRDDLADLKPSSRSAVLKWVHCGGNLIVHQAGKTSKDVETLERLLELNEHAAVGARWTRIAWAQYAITLCDTPTHARTGLRFSRSIARFAGRLVRILEQRRRASLLMDAAAWHRARFRDRGILQFHESRHPRRSRLRLHGHDHRCSLS